MHILNSLLPLNTVNLPDSRPQLPAWQLGQVLQAVVLKPTQGGKASLDVAGTRLQADSDLPLRSGEILSVRVEKQGSHTLLRVLNQFQPPDALQSTALRETIPKQEPMPPLLANLHMLADKNSRASEKLPQPWLRLIRQLVQSMPQAAHASTPEGLNRAMTRSGNFMEAGLLHPGSGDEPGEGHASRDLKANLMRLAAAISQYPSRPVQPGNRLAEDAPPTPRRDLPQAPQTTSPTVKQASASSVLHPSQATSAPLPQGASAPLLPQGASVPPLPQAAPMPPSHGGSGPQDQGAKQRPSPLGAMPTGKVPVRGAAPQAQAHSQPSLNLDLPLEQLGRELRSQVESGIARIQLNQLNSLPTDESPRHILMLELPIRDQDRTEIWSMRLEQELPRDGQQAAGTPWTVNLAFEFAELGPVHVRISLHEEEVSANFWVEQEATFTLIEDQLPVLEKSLREAGLLVHDLHCFSGRPPKPRGQAAPRGIVNLKV